MSRVIIAAALALLLPTVALASTFFSGKAVVYSEPVAGNAYLAGTSVQVETVLPADLVSAAGTLVVASPIAGDALLAGGTITLEAAVAGDVRAVGGQLIFEEPITGDLVVAGGVVHVEGQTGEAQVAGGTIEFVGGATGAVKIYGANVLLGGAFAGDVEVFASDHVTLSEGTVISGTLRYNAPQQADIPASAVIEGGIMYTGSSSFLPTVEEAQAFALAGAGVFFVAYLISGLLAAGLFAGIFPDFTNRVAARALFSGPRHFFLTLLLGFALLVATPVFLILLFVSVVGIGVALVFLPAYLLLIALSGVYGAVLAGAALSRGLFKRQVVSWKDAMLGMLVVQIISIIPGLGPLVAFVLAATAIGSIASLAFAFTFPRGENDDAS